MEFKFNVQENLFRCGPRIIHTNDNNPLVRGGRTDQPIMQLKSGIDKGRYQLWKQFLAETSTKKETK